MKPLDQQAIDQLLADTEPWLSCDDCFEQLDIAIEGVLAADASLTETIRVHLSACRVCEEEAQSLAALVAGDYQLTPAEAVARLDAAVAGRSTPPAPGAVPDDRSGSRPD